MYITILLEHKKKVVFILFLYTLFLKGKKSLHVTMKTIKGTKKEKRKY